MVDEALTVVSRDSRTVFRPCLDDCKLINTIVLVACTTAVFSSQFPSFAAHLVLPDLAIITKPILAVVLLLRRTMNIAWLLTDQSNCILLLRLRGLHDYL